MNIFKFTTVLAIAAPVMVYGQNIDSVIGVVESIIKQLTPIAFALGLLFFFWGLAMFILKSGEDKEKGKNIMIWGTLALFVMASVFGIINLFQDTLKVNNNSGLTVPQL